MNVTVQFESKREFLVSKDGNQFIATKHDFRDLQQDECGFGDTIREAVQDLCTQLHLGVPKSMDLQID